MELVIGLVVLGLVGVGVAKYLKDRKKAKKSPKQAGPGVGVPAERPQVDKK